MSGPGWCNLDILEDLVCSLIITTIVWFERKIFLGVTGQYDSADDPQLESHSHSMNYPSWFVHEQFDNMLQITVFGKW